jgi:glyoxylase-like metal-dependent hydrolase (beta-lactamase superfamily II)
MPTFVCVPITMKATILPVTPFQQNCSLLMCEETNQAAIVDPGGDIDAILEAVQQSSATVVKILLTHAHIDHCGGTAELADRLGVPVEGPHLDDKFWIDALPQQAQMFGFRPVQPFTPKRWLVGGDTVRFGNVGLEVRHVPGHTPGHVIFFSPADKLAITGDVLFAGSIGRTDFPRGDYDTLIRSIKAELWPLGDDVTFLPGHGPTSTFGEERQSNPYLAD